MLTVPIFSLGGLSEIMNGHRQLHADGAHFFFRGLFFRQPLFFSRFQDNFTLTESCLNTTRKHLSAHSKNFHKIPFKVPFGPFSPTPPGRLGGRSREAGASSRETN